MISFVIYFHSSRAENLRQTLRFLFARENCEKEVILICNDRTDEEFEGCELFNMNLSEYQKPLMCNFGVRTAKGSIIALLDSDRILPPEYFSSAAKSLSRGEFASCLKMIKLAKDYSDDEIKDGMIEFEEEERSEGWEIRRKNLFSGNTLFHREDYLASGGMDESFVGYGFADNDMTRQVHSNGFKAVWLDGLEVHLCHQKEVMESGKMESFDEYKKTSHKNLCKFLRKWKMKEYWKECSCVL